MRGPSYPFLALSMTDTVAVIPFEAQQSGKFQHLVFILPRGFVTSTFITGWKETLDRNTQEGPCIHIAFEDSRHQLVRGLDEDGLVHIPYLMEKSTPVIVTLTSKSN